MNFKEFCKSSIDSEKKYEKNVQENNTESNSAESKTKEQELQDKLNAYSKLSYDELISEFLKVGSKAKETGMYSDDKISQIKDTLFPFLTDEQKMNFDKLIGLVK